MIKNLQLPPDVSCIDVFTNTFPSLPLDYTTRTPEVLACKHLIVSREEMEQYMKDNELVEYDKTGSHYSGTSIQQIKVVMEAGKTCLLYLQPQVSTKHIIYMYHWCLTVLESYQKQW